MVNFLLSWRLKQLLHQYEKQLQLQFARLTEYPGWKISDGVYVTLTPEILQGASMAFMQHTGKAFAVEIQKLGEVETLDSNEAVSSWLENDLKLGWANDEG